MRLRANAHRTTQRGRCPQRRNTYDLPVSIVQYDLALARVGDRRPSIWPAPGATLPPKKTNIDVWARNLDSCRISRVASTSAYRLAGRHATNEYTLTSHPCSDPRAASWPRTIRPRCCGGRCGQHARSPPKQRRSRHKGGRTVHNSSSHAPSKSRRHTADGGTSTSVCSRGQSGCANMDSRTRAPAALVAAGGSPPSPS
jgi:hypothetical protein